MMNQEPKFPCINITRACKQVVGNLIPREAPFVPRLIETGYEVV